MLIRTLRNLGRHHAGFATIATLTIAGGMALVIAVSSVVKAVLFRPLPFRDADRLVVVYAPMPRAFEPVDFLGAIRSAAPAIERVASYRVDRMLVGRSGEARTMVAAQVPSEFFAVAGVSPVAGTLAAAGWDLRGGHAVAISHDLWVATFGGDRSIIGRELVVAGRSREIAAVLPPTFDFPDGASVWLPTGWASAARGSAGESRLNLARLADGADLSDARAQVSTLYSRVHRTAAIAGASAARVTSLRAHLNAGLLDRLQLWLAIALVVMAMCGVNFATTCFARGMGRSKEIAVRRTLGATVSDIVRVALAEAAACAMIGGAIAIVLAWWLMRAAAPWLGVGTVSIAPRIDVGVAVVGVGVAVVVGVLFALLPAIEIARTELRAAVDAGSTGATIGWRHLRGRKLLVGLQLAMALSATAVVGAVVEADRRYHDASVGVDYGQLLRATLYATANDDAVDLGPVIADVSATPAIESAATYGGCSGARMEGDRAIPDAFACTVSPSYFAVLRPRLLAGRFPTVNDAVVSADAVIISGTLATRVFGSPEQAIGKRVGISRSFWNPTNVVIGVIDDIGPGLSGFEPEIFRVRPPRLSGTAVLIARARGEPAAAIRPLERAIERHARVTVADLEVARDVVDRAQVRADGRRYFLVAISALAIGMAIIGVFGLTAWSTAQRARELGIRGAVGATPWGLVWLVLSDLRWGALVGVVAGVLASSRMAFWLDSMVRPSWMTTPMIIVQANGLLFTGVAFVVIVAAGSGLSAARILRMDIARALRLG